MHHQNLHYCQKMAVKVHSNMLKNICYKRQGPFFLTEKRPFFLTEWGQWTWWSAQNRLRHFCWPAPGYRSGNLLIPSLLLSPSRSLVPFFRLLQSLNTKHTGTSISYKAFLYLLFLDGCVCLSLIFSSACFRFCHSSIISRVCCHHYFLSAPLLDKWLVFLHARC